MLVLKAGVACDLQVHDDDGGTRQLVVCEDVPWVLLLVGQLVAYFGKQRKHPADLKCLRLVKLQEACHAEAVTGGKAHQGHL